MTTNVLVYVLIDEFGNAVASTDADALGQLFTDEHGDLPSLTRTFELDLTLPDPKHTSVKASIPDTDDPIEVTVSA